MGEFYAVVMAGGSGTRFWPLSRRSRPKQLLPILGGSTLLRQTVERLFPFFDASRVFVIAGREHIEQIRKELEILASENLIDEPVGRDTAPCVGLAATFLEWRDPGCTFAALPADHFIGDVPPFQAALQKAHEAAQTGALVTFGVKPRYPATGYGYLEREGSKVKRFCEKPDEATARRFVADGRHFWNSGMFVWKASAILAEIERHMPSLAASLRTIREALGTSRFPAVYAQEFHKLERKSIDFGVMEKAANVVMIEADFDWDDVGSWKAAAERRRESTAGLTECVDTEESLVLSTEDHLVATLGLKGMIVVHTQDATLVVPKDRADDLKGLIERLKSRGMDRLL